MTPLKLKSHKIKVTYFTDPVCSTCWVIEPYINKLLTEYRSHVEVSFKMGGLLPNWVDYKPIINNMPKAEYLNKLWTDQSKKYGVNLDGSIWLTNPIQSSYPASIAYYAAKNQGEQKASDFLRTIRQMVFMENKDISQQRHLITAAINNKINLEQFLQDIDNGSAHNQFKDDLIEKERWNITSFPSLIFCNEDGEHEIGIPSNSHNNFDDLYTNWENIIKKLTANQAIKQVGPVTITNLLKKHKRMSLSEIKTLTGHSIPFIIKEIHQGLNEGTIIEEQHKYAPYYCYNDTPFRIKKNKFSINKASILGGGICGNYLANFLKKNNVESAIYEKLAPKDSRGFGFLLLKNGIDALDAIGLKNKLLLKANAINTFKAITPDGGLIYTKGLEDCLAIGREDFLGILTEDLAPTQTNYNKTFEALSFNAQQEIMGVRFNDGSHIESEIYFASDGIRSAVRTQLFPQNKFTPLSEREIVGMVDLPELDLKQDEFIKIVDVAAGKSTGLIPLNNGKYIWFIQFNQDTHPINDNTPEALKQYAENTTENYPDWFNLVIKESDFNQAFLWTAHRMDILPAFHKSKVVLAGDAAHPLLALTSQGANSALEDAAFLLMLLANQQPNETLEDVFTSYYELRKKVIQHYIDEGDLLLQNFLNLPYDKNYKIPLSLH